MRGCADWYVCMKERKSKRQEGGGGSKIIEQHNLKTCSKARSGCKGDCIKEEGHR